MRHLHFSEYTRTAIKRIVPRNYEVTQEEVYRHIGSAKTRFSGGIGVNCCIPIKGKRLSIGGGFSASGGAPGWSSKGKQYKITTQMVKGQTSTLPDVMKHQGNNPPFINTTAPKLNGLAFTRTGYKTKNGKDAIVKVVGIGVPQMPLNRSEDKVQEAIVKKLIERLEHEHAWRVKKCQR